jgi:hypothetical protein
MRHPQELGPPWETFAMPRSRGRWWLLVAGGLLIGVASWVLTHDTSPGAALSLRSWLTLGLAALVVVLLNSYRAGGARLLVRAIAEYALVAALAVLLATSTAGGAGAGHHGSAAAAVDQRPAAVRRVSDAYRFVVGLWHQAQHQTNTDRQPTPTTTTRTRSR